MIQFIKSPFPDNHDGFDYSPKSFTDVQNEFETAVSDSQKQKREKEMMSMFKSIFK